jgi:hypothetical protein
MTDTIKRESADFAEAKKGRYDRFVSPIKRGFWGGVQWEFNGSATGKSCVQSAFSAGRCLFLGV